jgi:transposase
VSHGIDIDGGVDVTVVDRAAFRASPFTHAQRFLPVAVAARRTNLTARIPAAGLDKRPAAPGGLVLQLQKNRCLSKSIADASWSEFVRQLEYKAAWRGRTLVKASRWYPSSQICSACGHRDGKKALSVREWTCPECGTIHDRDINAAININTVGHTEIEACQT